MSTPHTTAKVTALPDCQICEDGTKALYDAKTLMGPWGYLCQRHFDSHTSGKLGMGIGQKLVVVR